MNAPMQPRPSEFLCTAATYSVFMKHVAMAIMTGDGDKIEG
jgi:hypothetical protein